MPHRLTLLLATTLLANPLAIPHVHVKPHDEVFDPGGEALTTWCIPAQVASNASVTFGDHLALDLQKGFWCVFDSATSYPCSPPSPSAEYPGPAFQAVTAWSALQAPTPPMAHYGPWVGHRLNLGRHMCWPRTSDP